MVQDVQPSQAAGTNCSRNAESATGPPALTVRECCASLNFWLLFTIFGVGTGLGLMFVNNLGELHNHIKPEQGLTASRLSYYPVEGRTEVQALK